MADQKGNAEGLSSQHISLSAPFNTSDYEVMKGMKVPETITVNPDRSMQNTAENRPAFQGTSQMIVPEKIVLKGGVESERQAKGSIALQSAGVNLDNYMGGMATPPRTLTVDDTRSRYMERNVDESESQHAREFDRLSHKLIEGSGNPDVSDFKLQGEIVQLKKRVELLEKRMAEKQSSGFWKTTFFCFFTIINPIIIHWLFSSKRY